MPPKKHKRDRFQGLAPLAAIPKRDFKLYDSKGIVKPKPLKKRSTTTIPREKFLDVVCDELARLQYLGVKQRLDLMVACRYTSSPVVPFYLFLLRPVVSIKDRCVNIYVKQLGRIGSLKDLKRAAQKAGDDFPSLMQYSGEEGLCHSSIVWNKWLRQVNSGDTAGKFMTLYISSSIHCVLLNWSIFHVARFSRQS